MEGRTTIGRVILVAILLVVSLIGMKFLLITMNDFARMVESIAPEVEIYVTQGHVSIRSIMNVVEWCGKGIWIIISTLAVLAVFPSKTQ